MPEDKPRSRIKGDKEDPKDNKPEVKNNNEEEEPALRRKPVAKPEPEPKSKPEQKTAQNTQELPQKSGWANFLIWCVAAVLLALTLSFYSGRTANYYDELVEKSSEYSANFKKESFNKKVDRAKKEELKHSQPQEEFADKIDVAKSQKVEPIFKEEQEDKVLPDGFYVKFGDSFLVEINPENTVPEKTPPPALDKAPVFNAGQSALFYLRDRHYRQKDQLMLRRLRYSVQYIDWQNNSCWSIKDKWMPSYFNGDVLSGIIRDANAGDIRFDPGSLNEGWYVFSFQLNRREAMYFVFGVGDPEKIRSVPYLKANVWSEFVLYSRESPVVSNYGNWARSNFFTGGRGNCPLPEEQLKDIVLQEPHENH
ncbi:MAG: hypothetical protein COV29_03170 [Candidatus Yanofskybacteria bacterium CG10_big_fil_rev_8_21_14_0_10_36_16]|uniref:Uncharacterized protein n=1 Tax=Candidatus Yanofskybacteria bacterium CG10_big_fil_rev_8_21_14_0_10_36_16 TaxID=1975096 RepID=A0A2J0Q6X7_9BACT|nr:MAG: hypothetical protein COV29_03170 [Candidatus Yanofskybacteria bacterium CG10_big_fil_rev_8_21_14_0_10_36_16]